MSDVAMQYAALPWRKGHGRTEILLITTRTTRRWIVPKGWPIPGLSPPGCAAHEAAEEAGVVGKIALQSMGFFRYLKARKNGDLLPCKVEVFALEVTGRRRTWPEKSDRETDWCSIEDALARVSEPGLRRLIASFARTAAADNQNAFGSETADTG